MFGLFKKQKPAPKLDGSQIVPRIKNTQFLPTLKAAGVPDEQLPVIEPLVADLIVTYAFDLPESFVMATPQLLANAGVERSALRQLAIENLRRQIPAINLQQAGSVYRAAIGNNLDACALLSERFWNSEADKLAGTLVAAVPNRDLVLFCDGESADGLKEMSKIVDEAYHSADTHALTREKLQWSETGWRTYTA
jgi:uncharacterized protein YtpQ (UPF0354 family)